MNVQNLKHCVINGVFWLLLQNVFTKLIYFFITVWLARILFPADFGIIASCMLVINFLNIFVDFGIGSAIVQNKSKGAETESAGFWLSLFFGIAAFLIAIIIAPFFADFFSDSTLSSYLRVMSVDILLTAFEVVPVAVLNKMLKFNKRVLPEIFFVVIFGAVALLMARRGYGAWSIISGTLCAHFVRTCLYWLSARPTILFVLDKSVMIKIFKYGYHFVGASFLLLILLNGDNAVVRKILGTASLGIYGLAYTIASLPATHITHIMGTVTFPLYSELQEDYVLFSRAFRKVLNLITAISVPAAVGIMVLAPTIVNTLYGPKWVAMIVPLQLLSIFGMVRSILSVCGNVFYALNKHDILKRLMLLQVLVMVVMIFPLTKLFGMIGTAVAINVAQILMMVITFMFISKLLRDDVVTYLRCLFRTFISSLIMGAVVYSINLILPFEGILKLVLGVFVGVLVYAVLVLLINKPIFKEVSMLICSYHKHDVYSK